MMKLATWVFPIILFCELAWYFLDEGFGNIPLTSAKALISATVITALAMGLRAMKIVHDRNRGQRRNY